MTIGGIAIAFFVLVASMVLEHGKPQAILNPSALLLVFGATIAATIAGGLRADARRLPRAIGKALVTRRVLDATTFAEHLLGLARDARTGGLNVFERELPEAQNDAFIRTGVELIATTSDPERVRGVLEAEILGMRERHRVCYRAFQDMAGYAPTIGILGTVIGLVHVLGSLSTPTTLGPEIATAFTATLWGVLSANLIWLPIASKLRRLSEEEVSYRELVIEGLLAVQEGLSGPQLRDRLEPFLPPAERSFDADTQPQLGQENAA
jgi:chemotaxis protein MotA